jgi:hypothetical protein
MIALYTDTDNPFSLYGIDHFMKKNGIPFVINKPAQSGIVIAYGVRACGDFVITLGENDIKNSLCGQISMHGYKIPLCEMPSDTGSDREVIAHFDTGSRQYPCVTRNDHGFSIGVDIFKETGYQLSGHLDTIRPYLDRTGQMELTSKPCVDFLEQILFGAIRTGCHERGIPLVQQSYWPHGKTFAVCLTHDVDEIKKTYQWITRPLRFLLRGDLSGLKDQVRSVVHYFRGEEPYYTYDDLMTIERDLGVKSTYFILKESGNPNIRSKDTWYLFGRNRSLQSPRIQALIRQLVANGDEIATHGSYFSYKDPVLLTEETRELEQLINTRVIGTRQHNLNLEIPATWIHQKDTGFEYDSTLGLIDTIGFRWGTSFPFFPNTVNGPIRLLEIPLIIMDICLEFSEDKESDCLRVADETKRYNGVLTLLWHPPIFNTLEYPYARDLYIKINRYCLEKGAWITRARDICEWLELRNKSSFTCEYDASAKTCIITPDSDRYDHYLTLHLPPHTRSEILSGNAKVITKSGDCEYIKAHDLQKNNAIIVRIS